LLANIQSAPDGSLILDFDNVPTVFTISVDGTQIASVSLTVDDIRIQPGQTVAVVGATADIPEPATLLLLSTGLAGVGAGVWKQLKGGDEGRKAACADWPFGFCPP
jgi:PEP-CTERM motif